MSDDRFELPYGGLVERLVNSVARAVEEVVLDRKIFDADHDHQLVNRHFAWLGVEYSDGVNRHLYDGDDSNNCYPLRTMGLRAHRKLPPQVAELFAQGGSVPVENAGWMTAYVRKGPTRISNIVFDAVERSMLGRAERTDARASKRRRSDRVWAPSPLAIVYNFLTIPAHPGSRSFALPTLRNYLFERLGIVPGQMGNGAKFKAFTARDLEEAMSVIWTSLRPRFFSTGKDKIPSRGKTASHSAGEVDTLVRHYLAMKGVLDLTFDSVDAARRYFSSDVFELSSKLLEFDRVQNLRNLPELGEVTNELWGLPIPIRGADTIFRGGLKFPARRGLVCALQGGPGSGKTSLSLGVAAALAPFGIRTVFITAEESAADLRGRTNGLVASDFRRLSFFPDSENDWLKIVELETPRRGENILEILRGNFEKIGKDIAGWANAAAENSGPPLPCRTIVVLDGLHDLVRRCEDGILSPHAELQAFVEACKGLEALVILTTGIEWVGDRSLDYLVDVAMSLSLGSDPVLGSKPDRAITLTKARHQLCSPGSHGFQLSGQKGVRFTPQINYQLDRLAIWEPKLPDQSVYKEALRLALPVKSLAAYRRGRPVTFDIVNAGTRIFSRSNTFINGQGSGGKAGLALNIATSPSFRSSNGSMIERPEKVLIISFLYPREYYDNLHDRLKRIRLIEYRSERPPNSRVEVIHLYPGHVRPATLFNRVMWTLDESELHGDPFTAVVVDGIHNVFIQFPEIERNQLFWPQLFSILGLRNLSTVVTHTLLSLDMGTSLRSVDDSRSDPLRHALVQKTDFSFEVDPKNVTIGDRPVENCFFVKTQSAIGQPYGGANNLYWHRDDLILLFDETSSK